MRLHTRGARDADQRDGAAEEGVAVRLRALDQLLAAGEGHLDESRLAAARALARRAGERLRLSAGHTVVALAGATGSGKSSLFNALTGADISTVGVRRPTTGVAHAAVWGGDGAGPLLDWLEIPRRHHVVPGAGIDLSGLVLLDLPDHDSTEVAHRLEVDRLVALVDVLVWVLDPQKYADAAVHDRYLRPLARHGEVMVVVLNQIDRLPPEHAAAALADVRRLLAEDGLADVPVLGTSAVAPGGRDELRALLTGAVAAHRAALRRVSADLDDVAADLADVVAGPARTELDAGTTRELVTALSGAAGVPAVGAAVQRASVHRAVAATGSPYTRWLRRLRPDPLRRLHLDRARSRPGPADAEADAPVARTSLPAASAVERSRVDLALRRLADAAADGLPDPWPDTVRSAARSRSGDLPDALDRAVATTDLGLERRPVWWRAVGLVQALLAAAALAGGLWLVGLYVLTVLRLPDPGTPEIGELPLPTALLIGGLVAGLLVALLARLPARIGGRRRRGVVESRLRTAVAGVADELVLAPVAAELAAYSALRDGVAQLRGR
jgi:GTP-binding protein EngB required for normal cell division